MKRLLGMVVCVAGIAVSYAEEGTVQTETATAHPNKIMLKIATVETPDTRDQKAWQPPAMPSVAKKLPYTEEAIIKAPRDRAAQMAAENAAQDRLNRELEIAVEMKNWKAADEWMRGARAKMRGTAYGRQVTMAVDNFAGIAGRYFDPECIEFYHGFDRDEGEKVAKIEYNKKDDHDLAGKLQNFKGTYFIKLVFDDPRIETVSAKMEGQDVTRKNMIQSISYSVQSNDKRIQCSNKVKKTKSSLSSNAVSESGIDEGARIELIEECMAQIAKEINDHFVAKVIVKAYSSVKGDEDFDENGIELAVDGNAQTVDSEFSILKGVHQMELKLDGYKQGGSKTVNIARSGPIKVKMISTMCSLTVTVKGSTGDDMSGATVELVSGSGENAETETLTAGEASKVKQGKYTLKVSMEGYETKTQVLSLAKAKQVLTVSLKKAVAAAAGAVNEP